MLRTYNRIEILGVPGSGKTTLARKLVTEGSKVLAEDHLANPFWSDEATNREIGFLAYDLTFLMQHIQLCTNMSPTTQNYFAICDWSFVSDRLWASTRLADDLCTYESVFTALVGRVPPPIGYLYLRQSVDTLVKRVSARGREPELKNLHAIPKAASSLEEVVSNLDPQQVFEVDDATEPEQLREYITRWTEPNADD